MAGAEIELFGNESGRDEKSWQNALGISEDVKFLASQSYLEAIKLNHEYVGTEHLLLGLMHYYPVFNGLNEIGAITPRIRSTVFSVVGFGERRRTAKPSLSPVARKAIDSAAQIAIDLKDKTLEPYHIALALVQSEISIASGILGAIGLELGFTIEDVRKKMMEVRERELGLK